jgi:hypothetical protein
MNTLRMIILFSGRELLFHFYYKNKLKYEAVIMVLPRYVRLKI